ncbi:MAG: hypothetical protein E7326_05555 [Clostridiales bacterium]|nr:hypothetical protein [Clostridiales bacterium]
MKLRRILCILLIIVLLPLQGLALRDLREGDSGADVKKLKEAMYYLGYFTSLNVSESYNHVMVERVKNLQRVNGLTETGIADIALQELVFSGKALPTQGAPDPTPVPPETPTPEPTQVPTPSPEPSPTPDLNAVAQTYETLREGDTGDDVLALKKAMYYLGYFSSLNLTDSFNALMTERIMLLQKNNGLEETGIADGFLQALVFSGFAVPTDTAPRPTAVPTAVPTPIAPQGTPELPPLTEQGFLPEGETEWVFADEKDGLWLYYSPSLAIRIARIQDKVNRIVWFETEVFTSEESPLTSYLSPSNTPGRRYMNPLDLVWNNHVVLGINDDFFGNRWLNRQTVGVIIRNGEIITTDTFEANHPRFPNLEVLAVFEDGSMKTFLSDEHTAEEYLQMGVTDTFAFGPILVRNGQLGTYMDRDDYYRYREPRTAIGMIEPHHYLILTVLGRSDESKGVYLPWLAHKMLEKGAVEAINLDGGGTVSLMFMGEYLDKDTNEARSVTSIIGFGTSEDVYKK